LNKIVDCPTIPPFASILLFLYSIAIYNKTTFEYPGGLGRVTKEAFHAILKKQLKMKRYQLKKRMVDGIPRPKHIRADNWLNLSNLIAQEAKVKQAEKLKQNRAQVKKLSYTRQSEGEVRANLVNFNSFLLVLKVYNVFENE
jgi:hypothetical protein